MELNLEDLLKWKNKTKVLYASCSRSKKHIYINLNGGYEVHHNDKVVFETMTPIDAIKKFNSLAEVK